MQILSIDGNGMKLNSFSSRESEGPMAGKLSVGSRHT